MKNNSEDGFTLLETLAAMGIISIVLTSLAMTLPSSSAALEKSKKNLLFGVKFLRADTIIRKRVGAIAIPYWEHPILDTDSSSLTIPWYQGKQNVNLRLIAEGKTLLLETEGALEDEKITLIDGLDGSEISILRDDQKIPYGIGIVLFHNQNTYHSFSAFASHPMGRNENR
jgi:prepilin-type N-terminal cleavage/methylation domain-containing protein